MFYLLLPLLESRQSFISHLKSRDIQSVFHYLPLYFSDMGYKFGGKQGGCLVTEDVSNRLLRLSFYQDMNVSDLEYVVSAGQESLP